MSCNFEELDYRETPLGALSLRRRWDSLVSTDVYEIKLGEDFLMTSLFTESEVALARLGLAELSGDGLDVVVGGLGLGYTAQEVLSCARVGSLVVVEVLGAVIDWHVDGLLPLGRELRGDARCRFVCGDFFELARSADGFDPVASGRKFDAVLVDIDHSPNFLLGPKNASFYERGGLERLTSHLKPGGVFGLWSNEGLDEPFVLKLNEVFASARCELVKFHNPIQNKEFTQSVYLARAADGSEVRG